MKDYSKTSWKSYLKTKHRMKTPLHFSFKLKYDFWREHLSVHWRTHGSKTRVNFRLKIQCAAATAAQKRSQMLFSRRIFGKQPKIVIPLRRTCWVEGIQQLRGRILTSYPPRVNNCGQFTWYLTPCLCDQAWITDHLPTSHLHVFIECPTIVADPLELWVNHKTRRSTQRDSP